MCEGLTLCDHQAVLWKMEEGGPSVVGPTSHGGRVVTRLDPAALKDRCEQTVFLDDGPADLLEE